MVENQKTKNVESNLKFLCSYSGRILPRSIDRKLRYVGGFTRVLSVDHSISFAELVLKLEEFCGYSVDLKCQLPNDDLDILISVKSDEDLRNILKEYNRVSGRKIRAILFPLKEISPRSSCDLSPKSPFSVVASPSPPQSPAYKRFLQPPYWFPPAENLPNRYHMRQVDDLSPKSPFSVVNFPSPPQSPAYKRFLLPPTENLPSRYYMNPVEYSRCCNCCVHNRDSKIM